MKPTRGAFLNDPGLPGAPGSVLYAPSKRWSGENQCDFESPEFVVTLRDSVGDAKEWFAIRDSQAWWFPGIRFLRCLHALWV